jgi:hypothetical protein
MMTSEVETKVVVFEPGNCTRYHLTITKIDTWTFAITDLNNKKVTTVSAEYPDKVTYQLRLQENGYPLGDAQPMAEYILKAVKETAFITYRAVDDRSSIEYKTIWFEDKQEVWESRLEQLGEEGHKEIKRGVIWDW